MTPNKRLAALEARNARADNRSPEEIAQRQATVELAVAIAEGEAELPDNPSDLLVFLVRLMA